MRIFPVACLWLMPRSMYIRYRPPIIVAMRCTRIITHLSDNVWHGFAPNRYCSYHKTILITAMLAINPVMQPLLVQLPMQLHMVCELLNVILLTMAAVSPTGLCAQLVAHQITVHKATESGGTVSGLAGATGWLRGELAPDWPVCVTTQQVLTKVCMTLLV